MKLALAIACAVVFVIHGIVFYDQFFHAWERNQTAYFDQARSQAQNDSERSELTARKPRIEQIIVTQFGEARVDRCTTCHIAADDPRFREHFQPLRTHSYSEALGDRQVNGRWERRHKFADFGCTVCHDGEGRGLEPFDAHGEDPQWTRPLMGVVTQESWRAEYRPHLKGGAYLEANCAQCHTEEHFPGTPHLAHGRELFFSKGCYGCHRIAGISDGTLGPELTDVGEKFKIDYLWESVVDPRANMATSFMPKFQMADDDVRDLVIFLKSRHGLNFNETEIDRYRAHLGGTVAVPPVTAGETATPEEQRQFGERLVRQRACTACHRIGDQDGGIAPDLNYVGLMRTPEWIQEHFKDPRAMIKDSIMPSLRLPAGEFEAMTAYLASLQTPPPPMAPAETFKQLCVRCHGEKGDGHGLVELYIDPAPRDLTAAAFMNSKPRARFEEALRNGVPGTSMPAWGRVLDDASRAALLDYVFATFVKEPGKPPPPRDIPEVNPVAQSTESANRGEAAFLKRCIGCHGRKADGKGPNSLDIVPRPRNLRNDAFVSSVNDQRLMESILYGVQGTAMPPWIDYGLSQNDAGDLVNYIRSLKGRR